MPGAKPLQMAGSRHAPNAPGKPRDVDAGAGLDGGGMMGSERNRRPRMAG